MKSNDTSSISFTALYTGQVWVANGLSSAFFNNFKGHFFYYSLQPLEWLGKHFLGTNVECFLLQRHLLIDHLLHQSISEHKVEQVLELACGLSPRGFRFSEQYPQLKYIETDLPAMAAQKSELLAKNGMLSDRHAVLELNIFSDIKSQDSLESVVDRHFDTTKPLVIISEGLVNYFSLEKINLFWKRLLTVLSVFSYGSYITDTYFQPRSFILNQTSRWYIGILRFLSRSGVCFHFETNHQVVHHFKRMGFPSVSVNCPQSYYHRVPIPISKTEPFVRIVEVTTKK